MVGTVPEKMFFLRAHKKELKKFLLIEENISIYINIFGFIPAQLYNIIFYFFNGGRGPQMQNARTMKVRMQPCVGEETAQRWSLREGGKKPQSLH